MPHPAPKVHPSPLRRAQQHDPAQRLESPQRQALYAVCLTPEVRKIRRRPTQISARLGPRTPPGADWRDMSHKGRAFQWGLRWNHQRGHHRLAWKGSAAYASERRAQDDPCSLSNPLPIFSEFRRQEAALGGVGHGRVEGAVGVGIGPKKLAAKQEDWTLIEKRVTIEEDPRTQDPQRLRKGGLNNPNPITGKRVI